MRPLIPYRTPLLVLGFMLVLVAWPARAAGPFPAGEDSQAVHAIAFDPATGRRYYGTGSGTVFGADDASLSRPPEAVDDSARTEAGTPVEVAVLANDHDPEDALDPASIEVRNLPVRGRLLVADDGVVTYTPDAGFQGEDGFNYSVRDLAGHASNQAAVSLEVTAPPVDEEPDDGGGGNNGSGGSSGGGALGLTGLVLALLLGRRCLRPRRLH